jgi:hypothetical protein
MRRGGLFSGGLISTSVCGLTSYNNADNSGQSEGPAGVIQSE